MAVFDLARMVRAILCNSTLGKEMATEKGRVDSNRFFTIAEDRALQALGVTQHYILKRVAGGRTIEPQTSKVTFTVRYR